MNLDIRTFVNVVTTILDYFLENIAKSTQCGDPCHLEVDLTNEDDFCVIFVTNFGCSDGHFEDILESFFNELSPRIEIHSYFKTITVIVKVSRDEEWAYDLRYPDNRACQICMRRLDAKETRRFAHMKKYQCFKLKCTLPSKDIATFTESLSRNIKVLKDLHSSYPNAKYTFHSEGNKICDSYVEPNNTTVNCKMMSSAIMKIIGRSKNDEFRTQCLTLLDASDTRETSDTIISKLTSLVPVDSCQDPKRKDKVSTASRNNRTKTSVIINQKNKKDYRENKKVNRENNKRVNEENTRVTEPSSNTSSDQGRTNGKENNRADTVALPITVSSRGRRVKKTKFYDEMHNS